MALYRIQKIAHKRKQRNRASDDAQVEAMVQRTVATFGRLDADYNNARVPNVLADTADSPRDDYDRIDTMMTPSCR